MADIDWGELFGLSMPALELVIRGSTIYWFLFLMFRFVLRRDIGSIGITDVLFVVVIADAAQNAMAGEYKSITDGFILIATIASRSSCPLRCWRLSLRSAGLAFGGVPAQRLLDPDLKPRAAQRIVAVAHYKNPKINVSY